MEISCQCLDTIETCTLCTKCYCSKCLENKLKEDCNDIMKKNLHCLQCSYKKFTKLTLVYNNSSDIPSRVSPQCTYRRKRRHSWHGISKQLPESEDNFFLNDIPEKAREIIHKKFLKKADQFLVFLTESFEKMSSFKNKISKKFLSDDVASAYTFLIEFICASRDTLNLWREDIEEIKEVAQKFMNKNASKKKIKFNLSLKKSKVDQIQVESNAEIHDSVEVPKDLDKGSSDPSIDVVEDTSNDSIFSVMTQARCENLMDCDLKEENITDIEHLDELITNENEMDDIFTENTDASEVLSNCSERSYVFNINRTSLENGDDNNFITSNPFDEETEETVFKMCTVENIYNDPFLGKENLEIQKINFLKLLGLNSKDEEENEKEHIEERRIQEEDDIERRLRLIEDEHFIMSEEESLGGDIEDAVTHEYIELQEGIYGKITNTLPNLPFANERSVIADPKTCSNTYEDHNLKSCSVTLERIDEAALIIQYDNKLVSDEDKEQLEIERLLNLNGLENKRKCASSPSTSKKKIKTNSKEPSSDMSDIDLESDDSVDEAHSNLRENVYPVVNTEKDGLDVLENLLKEICEDDDDNVEEEDDNAEEKTESDNSSKKTRNKEKNQNQSDKENQQVVGNSVVEEPHNSNLKTDKDSNWKNDPLLTCSLKEKPERDSIISNLPKVIDENKLLDRIKKLEARMMKSSTIDSTDTTDNKNEVLDDKEDKPSTSTLNCISDEEDEEDVEAKYSKIIVDSESDSDIEFVSVYKNLKKNKDNKNDSDDSEVRKGRRNIRAILDYETLTLATKEAYQLERKRKNRLTQKQKNMDAVLSSSQLSEEEEGLILDIDEMTKTPTITVDRTLSKKLKPHQKLGVKFMWESCYEGVNQIKNKYPGSGCILAHCMGLGKTFQVIALIHTLFSHKVTETKHVLIITPLSVVLHWKKEFELAFKNIKNDCFKIFFISDSRLKNIERMTIVNKWRRESGVLTMGYESYHRLISPKNPDSITPLESDVFKALSDPGPDLIVLDEGHLIKNDHSIRSKSFRRLKTKRRIVLTGTPLQNNLTEYYYMIQFVKPNLLGSLHEYKNRFANPITNGQYHDSTEVDIIQMKKRSHVLNKLLKGTVQRFELSELVPYLKKRHDYALFIQLHPLQMELYEKEAQSVSNATEQTATYKQVLGDYHKFKFIWGHPYMFHLKEVAARAKDANCLDTNFWWNGFCPPDSDVNINYGPKFKVMLNIIRECEKIGDKILVFSNSLLELSAIEHFLRQFSNSESKWECNKDYIRMDGSTSIERRIQFCDSFNDKNNTRLRVFLISNKVGQMGINLIGANRVILMDVSWNPAQDVQSVFRIYRFGQEKECYIYRLISMGTMEEVVYDRQVTKLAISGRVIDSLQITRHFKSNDLQMLYRPRFNRNQIRPTPPLPADCLLAKVLQGCNEIFRYHEHQSLLENLPEENLNEDEMKLAWDEFNKENEHQNQMQMRNKALMNAISSASNAAQNGILYVGPSVEHNLQVLSSSTTPFSTTPLNNNNTYIRNNQVQQCKRVITMVDKRTNENNAVIIVESDNTNSNKTENVTNDVDNNSHKMSGTVLHSGLAPINNSNNTKHSISIDLTANFKNKLFNNALGASTSDTTTLQQSNFKQTSRGKSNEGNVIIVEGSSKKAESVTNYTNGQIPMVLHKKNISTGLTPINNSNNNKNLNNSIPIGFITNLKASTSNMPTLQHLNSKQTIQGKSNEGKIIMVQNRKKRSTGPAPINSSNNSKKQTNSNIPMDLTSHSNNKVVIDAVEASAPNTTTLQHLNSNQIILEHNKTKNVAYNAHNQNRKGSGTVLHKKKISTGPAPINSSKSNTKLKMDLTTSSNCKAISTAVGASTSNASFLQQPNSKQTLPLKNKTDEIINLDDDNLLMMEQQLLITQLHQNLDLTLSAIQTSKPEQSIQREQKEDIIEID